jgi:flagellar biogenesis protein FliO
MRLTLRFLVKSFILIILLLFLLPLLLNKLDSQEEHIAKERKKVRHFNCSSFSFGNSVYQSSSPPSDAQ